MKYTVNASILLTELPLLERPAAVKAASFEHVEFCTHGAFGASHYATFMKDNHPDERGGFAKIFSNKPTGETGAPEISYNPVPRELYHTDWIADRVVAWLDSLSADDDWFCWMSFPDPHHPWDPPGSERYRVNWRDLDLPAGHPGSDAKIREILGNKPAHWLAWYEGRIGNVDAAPGNFVPASMTHDQFREVLALIHIENELIDEACGRVLKRIGERGWDADTDVFYTADHGEFQGDYGLLYKGPYHTDSLMRLPYVWRPAPSAGITPAVVTEPVGQLDLAPTFCAIAGVPVPDWMDGSPLPTSAGSDRVRAITEWDSQLDTGYHFRTIVRDGWMCTAYEPSTPDEGLPMALIYSQYGMTDPVEKIVYDGTEGELYHLGDDPHQFINRWNDPACAKLRGELVADLYDNLPPARQPALAVQALA